MVHATIVEARSRPVNRRRPRGAAERRSGPDGGEEGAPLVRGPALPGSARPAYRMDALARRERAAAADPTPITPMPTAAAKPTPASVQSKLVPPPTWPTSPPTCPQGPR